MKNKSFKDLIDRIDWVLIEPRSGYVPKISNNEIAVGFFRRAYCKLAEGKADEVRIKLGAQILQQMDWDVKDKIGIFIDPDDCFNFLLVKNEKGFKVCRANNTSYYQISFKWDREIKLELMKPVIVEYEIHAGKIPKLVFRISEE